MEPSAKYYLITVGSFCIGFKEGNWLLGWKVEPQGFMPPLHNSIPTSWFWCPSAFFLFLWSLSQTWSHNLRFLRCATTARSTLYICRDISLFVPDMKVSLPLPILVKPELNQRLYLTNERSQKNMRTLCCIFGRDNTPIQFGWWLLRTEEHTDHELR